MSISRDQADALTAATMAGQAIGRPSQAREEGAARLSAQTEGMFERIAGRRVSERMEREAAVVLENLRGHRDRGDAIGPLTEEFLRRAAQGNSPAELLQAARESVSAHAQSDPRAFTETVMSAVRAGTINAQEAITLLAANNHPVIVGARVTLETAENIREASSLEQRAQMQMWSQRQQEMATVTQVVKPEPEPEPEPESIFNSLTDRRTSPRRLLKKLKTKRNQG